MRITQLTLHGFKSFGNRTTIEFSPAVTAIVGPNGSGKSNLLDALKWATGGGRASAYRAGEKRELIFHGAAGKRSVGMAEVEVELRDGRRSIKINRSLAADGTSKLKLDGALARFLDVDDVLAGTGLGTSGLAVIGQGEVSQVLMADPERLLAYVAEAAGVARLTGRREQTEQRLATAGQHLERLQDVVDELEVRLETLAEEAAQAGRHQELSREALQLRFTVAVQREAGLRQEIGALAEKAGALAETIVDQRTAVADAKRALAAAKEQREAAEAAYREALADTEAKRGNLRVAETRLTNLHDQKASLRDRHDRVATELAGLDDIQPPTEPAEDVLDLASAEDDARRLLAEADDARSAARRRVLAAEDALAEHRSAVAEIERARAAAQAKIDALSGQLAHVESQIAQLPEFQTDLDALEKASADADGKLAILERQLENTRAELTEAQRAHADVAAEAMALGRAAERQRAAFASRRGYAEGPRNALTSGINGVLGSVADLLDVPVHLQAAISGALGRRSEYVVVADARVGEKVIGHVRSAGGYVTVLPLDLVRGGRRSHGAISGEPGVVGEAADLVGTEPRFRAVADQLLGGTIVVEKMDDAVRVARTRDARPRMVTLEGDNLDPSGAMSGGRRHGGVDVLGAARELEQAEHAAAEAAEQEAALRATLRDVQERTKTLVADREVAARESREVRAQLAQSRERAAAERRARADLIDREETVRTQLAQVELPAEEVDPAIEAELVATLELAREAFETADAAMTSGREVHAAAQREHALAVERLRSYRAALAQYERDLERIAALRERRGELDRELVAIAETVISAQTARDEAAAAVPTDLAEKERAYRATGETVAERENAANEAADVLAVSGEALEQVRVHMARRESALEIAAEEASSFPDGIAIIDIAERTAKGRLRDVEDELGRIGPVNHRAAQEHAREHERYEALQAEMVQAELAAAELAGTLERLDKETTARLRAAIAGLSERFEVHVRELFSAEAQGAIDVEADGNRPVGLRIRLQPPGKQTQSLNLLSVGERTMGALAFLFALMAVEGSEGLPVAVLDEVDAPLDEANIRRYCRFVERLSAQGTQFVLITHQKATFEVADTLWGVTTEQGVSRVFSISRREHGGPAEVVAP